MSKLAHSNDATMELIERMTENSFNAPEPEEPLYTTEEMQALINALHTMDETGLVAERTFTDHGHYFSVTEPPYGGLVIEPPYNGLHQTKTHISFHKSAVSDHRGLQIIRFTKKVNESHWRIATNAYSGIYLLPQEWEAIMNKALTPFAKGSAKC